MRLDGRTVDHRARWGIAAGNECREYPLPQTALAPAVISIEDRRIRPVLVGKSAPTAALAQPMDDPADDAAIVHALRSGVDHREMRLDRRPLLIAEREIVRHESSPPDELESQCECQFNWVRTLVLDSCRLPADTRMAGAHVVCRYTVVSASASKFAAPHSIAILQRAKQRISTDSALRPIVPPSSPRHPAPGSVHSSPYFVMLIGPAHYRLKL